ncbi:MAG TPA: oligoendopeptidase F [Firmicutes bacterium]|nr:oligoendopeptidase F [Bacillota bacterium]
MELGQTVEAIPERKDIPSELKWKIEDIYASDQLCEVDMSEVRLKLPEAVSYAGQLGRGARKLLECLRLRDEIDYLVVKTYTYSRMRKDEDNANPAYQSMHDRAASLAVEATSATAFFKPEILAIPRETLQRFMAEEPKLELYRVFLDNITRMREHTLSASEERIMAMAGEIGHAVPAIFTMLNNADLKYPSIVDESGNTVEVTKGRYIGFMESRDRRVRQDAFDALYSSYRALINTIAATYSASVKSDSFNARVRGYESARHASLDQNNIPVEVYDNLISAVRSRVDLMHRYARLRKKALGLPEVHMYDVYTPIVPDVEWPVTYDEAKEMVREGLAPLGEEYIHALSAGMESGWIDVLENRGKTSGAYSWGTYGVHPYVLLNWQDNLSNVFTLAHEMGHSMHSYYTWTTQPYVYSDYSIFVAEVASTVNEVLLTRHLLGRTDDLARRMYLLNHFMEEFRGTVFRQTMFAEFEKITHEMHESGQALTPDAMSQAYLQLNRDYFGPDMVLDDSIAFEWARIPHFYTAYYVYQYSTGFSAAVALANGILDEGAPARERYLDFLSGGSARYPIDLLRRAGVDMTSPEPVLSALGVFEKTLDEMETFFEAK